MENFIQNYTGEIMTAFCMLVIMLIVTVNLFLKSQEQQREISRRNDYREREPRGRERDRSRDRNHYQYGDRQGREMGGFTWVAFLSFVLIAGLYISKNKTEIIPTKEGVREARMEEESPKSTYPTIGLNKDRLARVEEEQEALPTRLALPHPPIMTKEYDRVEKEEQELKTVANKEDGYSCQVGAYSTAAKAAEILADWTKTVNIEGFVVIQETAEGKELHKVFLGHFASLKAAQDFTKKLGIGYAKSKEELPGFRP